MNDGTTAMPWWQSKIILGVVLSVVCKVLVISGLTGAIDSDVQKQVVDTLVLLLGGVGDLYAIAKRVTQKQAPTIVASNAKAAELNAVSDGTEGGPWPLGN